MDYAQHWGRIPVDEHFVKEGSRVEALQGKIIMSPPADEPHANVHAKLAYVLEAHVAAPYRVAVDMLTRTSEVSNFAPDASVYLAERDFETGGRQLEELAFEVVGEQWIGVPTLKARELSRRGVRRIFALVVKTGQVLEWSAETDAFGVIPATTAIEDPCFALPLPLQAILDATSADPAVVAALRARGALQHLELAARGEGKAEGLRAAVRAVALVMDLALSPARIQMLEQATPPELESLLQSLQKDRCWPQRS